MAKKRTASKSPAVLVPPERIENTILQIRGEKVILDADLASLYGVPTKRLNEQVGRNIERFPDDFMFQLTAREKQEKTEATIADKWRPPGGNTLSGGVVGDTGIEPVTPSMSTRCSPAELRAHFPWLTQAYNPCHTNKTSYVD